MGILDDELRKLKEKILILGCLVEEGIRKSVKALIERDSEIAKQVISRDNLINGLEVEINEECIRLIALRQPLAKDLRFITTAMKISTDLERMGDSAVNIAERAIELNQEPFLKPFVNIPKMAEVTESMVEDAIDAFVKEDIDLCYDVIKRDDKVDELLKNNHNELFELMVKNPDIIPLALKRMFIAKYLERIADHATNIAEMVIYMVEGKMLRQTFVTEEIHKLCLEDFMSRQK
ncbi:MAG TPA: phosphate signaling complex protein PhoU [Thermodesulfovibrio thiophilus]|uniref:phosphate signaling complex protein PhoU n=1 Tax=Thermodesulfovibrio thiophilus TaxID=340095 RepID=UPI00179CD511|nr:phosphate signaling complex protein PhoU [Thermodesulfovibrio thiophilus]HHW20762.1 phosphate signaling complex protein PhoU [Thermodesulfovibrio thiophilus]HOA83866.1 phosphate signaling complex protein PhoU [Thermodesulfovibrio thiophilus]HQA03790.1 phosphate signaling complex protein PhoU [Thermodesulfovibrio thiophilus]HQD36447.1 phosphate signaling complex protein PhoU [Thermodesulfovibrio thiophilus]